MNAPIELATQLLRELCPIPAPSHHEEARAAYCLQKLHSWGLEQAFVDEANNVLCLLPGEDHSEMVVFAGHTDVVFPDTAPLPMTEEGDILRCPGCSDDTVAVALLMTALRSRFERGILPRCDLLFALNSCEEGLGNLKGTRAIFARYGDRIRRFYTLDGTYHYVVNRSVGSHRYRVTVKTQGGHSYNDFGHENAARVLAEGIAAIYRIPLPEWGKTTYNVGLIEGGTSVNTIVQEASMLCEYRSDRYESLDYMQQQFEAVFAMLRENFAAEVTVTLVGERPCMKAVDPAVQQQLTERCIAVQQPFCSTPVAAVSGSTDCNIPHSLGIPAICVGVCNAGGIHTREEWISLSSVADGYAITEALIGDYFPE